MNYMEVLVNKLYLVENIIDQEKCNYLIEYIKKQEVSQKPIKGIGYNFIIKNTSISKNLWEEIKNKLPIKFHTFVKTVCTHYQNSDSFNIHRDIPVNGSDYKLLIYLNDCQGGETVYYDDDEKEIARFHPKAGNAVLFYMDQLHEAKEVYGEKFTYALKLK